MKMQTYPCGCSATGSAPLPAYCPEHGTPVCQHGTAVDVHCCNCHSGFLFDAAACVCRFDDPAIAALKALLKDPYGCSLCDSGTPRNPAKGHQPDCPYERAKAVIAAHASGVEAEALVPQEQEPQ